MKKMLLVWLLLAAITSCFAQQTRLWSEDDRKHLLTHLTRSQNELLKETKGLTEAQWNFKESPDRWSIKEVIEHIALWELLLQREASMAYLAGPQPALLKAARQDSTVLQFILEETPHVSAEYTKPFTFSLPLGLNSGESNLAWYNKMRNESINYLQNTADDLRLYFLKAGRGNIHQIYISTFGHTDRHLRQIRKIKQHKHFPG